ncbi:hypothetical protein EU805_02965 [Salipiger sp. IMCC34102]|uniref:hypothetical protein n=1 Tax=Salipiger sp. IMCC34102 TaxID=2510647 RepID=UPI00101C8F94|nr:hypothetical protein [Salipiger sp. IMCC34102]RYH04345.1 hypothetical protein EU805_02965 [Salipiger sp. IMCC34102]
MTHPQIVFHIGAHKTATTHLQHSIGAVADLLAMEGVNFFGPQSLRGPGKRLEARFDLPFNPRKSLADTRPAAVVLDEMTQGAHRLVLSEENFIGILFDKDTDGPLYRIGAPLYPQAGPRLDALAARIAPEGVDICLGLRAPAGFLTSAYGQALLAEVVVSEERFRNQNPMGSVDWVDLVARLRSARGVRTITVWRQEEYHALFPRILAAMLGPASHHVAPVAQRVNPGLSRAAVDVVLKLHGAGQRGPLAHHARDTLPIGPDTPAFQLFGPEDAALSAEFYAAQWDEIGGMEGVTVLKPVG